MPEFLYGIAVSVTSRIGTDVVWAIESSNKVAIGWKILEKGDNPVLQVLYAGKRYAQKHKPSLMNDNQAHRWMLAAVLAFCAPSINAQTPSCSVNWEGYTVIDTGRWKTVRYETGTNKVVMPTVSKTSTNAVQASGSAARSPYSQDPSQPGCTATSHYQGAGIAGYGAAGSGSVHAWARNSAVASPPAILDPGGVPYLPSPYTVVASIAGGAEAHDYLTISSTNLPKGTPINFTWHTYFDGYGLEAGYNPFQGFGNTEAHLNYIVPFNFDTTGDAGDSRDGGGGADGFFSRDGTLQPNAKVGDAVPISLAIGIGGEAAVGAVNSSRGIPRDWSSGAVVNMSHTAYMWFSDIRSGVQFTSASGYDYTVRANFTPTVAEVPVLSAHFVPESSQVELCWKSQTNVNYQVQFLLFLPPYGPAQWVDLGAPVEGNGSTRRRPGRHFVTVTPDYRLRVRPSMLDEEDGPTLEHGLKKPQGTQIILTSTAGNRPDQEGLAKHYEAFLKAAA